MLKLVVNNKPKKDNWFKRNKEEIMYSVWILIGAALMLYVAAKLH